MNEDFFAKALLISCVFLFPILEFDHLTGSLYTRGAYLIGHTPEEKKRISDFIKSQEHTKINRLYNLLFGAAALANVFICSFLRFLLKWRDFDVCSAGVIVTSVLMIWPGWRIGTMTKEAKKKFGLDP